MTDAKGGISPGIHHNHYWSHNERLKRFGQKLRKARGNLSVSELSLRMSRRDLFICETSLYGFERGETFPQKSSQRKLALYFGEEILEDIHNSSFDQVVRLLKSLDPEARRKAIAKATRESGDG